MRIALYQPEIPGNVGAILRLAACLGASVDIIEPCGFIFDDKRLRRAGMDYLDHVSITRHPGWSEYHGSFRGRLVLLSSKASTGLHDFAFSPGDNLLLGQESAGVPDFVLDQCDAAIRIPLASGMRSLNVATACAIALAEALRQTGEFPHDNA